MSKIYDCEFCSKSSKRKHGCFEPKKRPVIKIGCICGGKENCKICGGKNMFPVYQCPSVVFNDFSTRRIYKHYQAYREHHIFPDGRGAYYQPLKMIEAFNFLTEVEHFFMVKKNGK